MSVEARAASGVVSAASRELAILAARDVERATLPAAAWPNVSIVQCGPGPERAAAAADAALAAGAAALCSWGVAGALDADVVPGTVVLPAAVATSDGARLPCDATWHAALVAALANDFTVDTRLLLSVPRALAAPADKSAAARASGAVAVDMESAAIAAAAQRAGARFAALRVIVDARDDALPASPERWVDERGNRRLGAVLGAAFTPREWPVLWRLAQRYRTARNVLVRLAARLGPQRFCVPDGQ